MIVTGMFIRITEGAALQYAMNGEPHFNRS